MLIALGIVGSLRRLLFIVYDIEGEAWKWLGAYTSVMEVMNLTFTTVFNAAESASPPE